METKEVFSASILPADNEYIIYYFQPFDRWYVGRFYNDSEFGQGIVGRAGFTSWDPEVTKWMKGE